MTQDLRLILLDDNVLDKLPLAIRQWWPVLVEQVINSPPVLEALLDWLAHPADEDSQAVFRVKLRGMLEKNPAQMAEFERIFEIGGDTFASKGEVASGAGGIAVGGDIYGSVVVGRDSAIENLQRSFGESNVVVRGDSNTIVVNVPEMRPTDLRSSYLRRILAEQSPISLAGVDPKSAGELNFQIDLPTIYIPLLTTTLDTQESSERAEIHMLSAVEQINRNSHLVLLGEPGSGKSTFLNYVSLCLAGEDLGHPDINLKALTAPLEEVNQHWEHGPLLPLRVILRQFAVQSMSPAGQPSTNQNLWQFISNELRLWGFGDYVPFLRSEFLQVGGLLLLDGLDEVSETEGQRIQIKAAIEDFAATFPRVRILITSRTNTYAKQSWRLQDFAETSLAPFTPFQVEQFVNRWYAQLAAHRSLAAEKAQIYAASLKHAIATNQSLSQLARQPLMLTLMVSLHAERGELPEKREEFYADTIDLLFGQWERAKASGQSVLNSSLSEWLKVDRYKVGDLLAELAYEAQIAQTTDVNASKLAAGLINLSFNPEVNPKLLMTYLSERMGLLIQRTEDEYAFPHRAIQEYLAACHLTEHGYPELVADLVRQDPTRWREIAMLAAARAGRGTPAAVWFLVEALCPHEPSEQADAKDYWGALIAAQALVENVSLSAVGTRDALRLNRVRGWLIQILADGALPPLERSQAGDYLAQLGDPRPAVINVSPMEFCQVPAGTFVMGEEHSDTRISHLIELPQYQIARNPVTFAQWQEFVQSGGYQSREYWTEAGWRWITAQQGPRIDRRNYPNHPVTGVTWHEAIAFCRWFTDVARHNGIVSTNEVITLPSEAEWEKAARGSDRRQYPWGNDFRPEFANTVETNIGVVTPVGIFPLGASPYGVLDMGGNVMEWTRSLWGAHPERPEFNYPYHAHDGRENLDAPDNIYRVLRGGAFNTPRQFIECSYRVSYPPYATLNSIGFRVARIQTKA